MANTHSTQSRLQHPFANTTTPYVPTRLTTNSIFTSIFTFYFTFTFTFYFNFNFTFTFSFTLIV